MKCPFNNTTMADFGCDTEYKTRWVLSVHLETAHTDRQILSMILAVMTEQLELSKK